MSTLYVDTISEKTSGNGITLSNNMYAPGHVLQVVNNFIITNVSTTSTTFVDSGLSASITPKSTSSKVLAIVNIGGWYVTSGSTGRVTVYRDDTTNLGNGTYGLMINENSAEYTAATTQVLDSPSTTSSVEYSVYHHTTGGTSYISWSSYGHFGITLMEIGG